MLYLESFSLPSQLQEELFLNDIKMTCYNSFYPFQVFMGRRCPTWEFAPVTIFYGGNGSGKSTLLNVIAEKLRVKRGAAYNRTDFFEDYVALCDFALDRRTLSLPAGSRIITSDDVFDFLLNLRSLNQGVDTSRAGLLEEYTQQRKRDDFRLQSMADYEELRTIVDARRMTKSKFIRSRLPENVRERSNGESALAFFTEAIQEDALYLLDEPENSLSPKLQLELRQFLADSARFYRCQLIIATHSPFLLSLPQAKVYDLDAAPPCESRWTELENVRAYRQFFLDHADEF